MILTGDCGQTCLHAPHGGAEFRDELIGGVAVAGEPAGEVAVEPVGVAGPVHVLVGEGPGVVGGVVELGERRDVDDVRRLFVACPVPALDHGRAGGREVGLGRREPW